MLIKYIRGHMVEYGQIYFVSLLFMNWVQRSYTLSVARQRDSGLDVPEPLNYSREKTAKSPSPSIKCNIYRVLGDMHVSVLWHECRVEAMHARGQMHAYCLLSKCPTIMGHGRRGASRQEGRADQTRAVPMSHALKTS